MGSGWLHVFAAVRPVRVGSRHWVLRYAHLRARVCFMSHSEQPELTESDRQFLDELDREFMGELSARRRHPSGKSPLATATLFHLSLIHI